MRDQHRAHSIDAEVVRPTGMASARVPAAITVDTMTPSGASPEYRLILDCLAWFVAPSGVNQAWDADLEKIDWEHAVQLCMLHGLASVVYHVLTQTEIAGYVKPDALDRLRRMHVAQAAGYLTNRFVLNEVVEALARAGISSIPLKGVSVAERVYPVPALRRMVDIDLLVHPRQLQAAAAVLEQIGFAAAQAVPDPGAPADHFAYDVKFLRPGSASVPLELHWLLCDDEVFNNPGSALDSARVWERSAPHAHLDGAREMSPEDELLYLCAHSMKHRWRALYVLVDVALYVQRAEIDWQVVQERIPGLGRTWTYEATLILSSALLRTPLPPQVATYLERQWRESERLRTLVQHLLSSEILIEPKLSSSDPFSPWTRYLKNQRLFAMTRRTPLGATAYWFRQLTTPDAKDRGFINLPRGLNWLYCILRPCRLAVLHARYRLSLLRQDSPVPEVGVS